MLRYQYETRIKDLDCLHKLYCSELESLQEEQP